MEDLEYITKDALMMCDQGGAPDFFKPTFNEKVKIHGCLVATNMDGAPLENIPSFKICKITQKPCMPLTAPMLWKDTWQVKVKNVKTLIGKSTCPCSAGGTIEFMTSGQVPLPPDAMAEVTALQEQADKELNDNGYGDSVGETGFVEGMVPVWGSGRDLINDIQTGDGWGIVANGGFLIWDVVSIGVGVFSFGVGTAAMQGAKATVIGASKGIAKKISIKALQQLGKSAFEKLTKEALKKSLSKVSLKLGIKKVLGCFTGETLIHTNNGLKEIKNIKIGDRVFSFSEEEQVIVIRKVTNLFNGKVDEILEIITEEETIKTTRNHPFYVNGEFKDAEQIEIGDYLFSRDEKRIKVVSLNYILATEVIYNFEVEENHSYFVGENGVLVHNSCGKIVIGLTDDAIEIISKRVGRIDHAARHLIEAGIITANPGSKQAREAMASIAKELLSNPSKSFDYVIKGGLNVKGFYKKINGQDIIIYLAKEGKGKKVLVGDIVTAITPTIEQIAKFGI